MCGLAGQGLGILLCDTAAGGDRNKQWKHIFVLFVFSVLHHTEAMVRWSYMDYHTNIIQHVPMGRGYNYLGIVGDGLLTLCLIQRE